MFDYQDQKVIDEIKKRNVKLVLVQLPEGIKKEAVRIVKLLEKETSAKVIVSGETCWGGCDISLDEAKNLKADLIIHYGHAPFKTFDFPIFYVEMHDDFNILPLLKESLNKIEDYKIIGLVASIQHVYKLNEAKSFLEKNNKEVIIPKRKGYGHYDGHVVGCEYGGLKEIQKEINCSIVIGNKFHSLGAALATKKPTFLIDVYNNEVTNMEDIKDKIIRQRFNSIQKLKEAKKVGIIIGTKPGQQFGSAEVLMKYFTDAGKETILITMSEVTQDKLLSFYDIEGFVELACPRIATEDYEKYSKPIITFKEAMVVVDKIPWEKLLDNGLL